MNPSPDVRFADAFPLDLLEVWDAMQFVYAAHQGRLRWDGTPEFYHLLDVASRVAKHGLPHTEAIITSLLHDVVEDTSVTLTAVYDAFGPEIAENVDELTQRPGESRHDYLSRVLSSDSEVVLAVKVADRCDNVRTLHTCPSLPIYKDHVETYFHELDTYFMPMLDLVPESLANELVGLTNRARSYFNKAEIIQFPRGGRSGRPQRGTK